MKRNELKEKSRISSRDKPVFGEMKITFVNTIGYWREDIKKEFYEYKKISNHRFNELISEELKKFIAIYKEIDKCLKDAQNKIEKL